MSWPGEGHSPARNSKIMDRVVKQHLYDEFAERICTNCHNTQKIVHECNHWSARQIIDQILEKAKKYDL